MKKTLLMLTLAIAGFAYSTQVNAQQQYTDLVTGKAITIIRHSGNGIMFNTATSRPVYLYIDRASGDTFYGRTGEKVNGKLSRNKFGNYQFTSDSYVYKNGDYQLRTEADGYDTKRFDDDGDVILTGQNKKKKVDFEGDVKRKNGEAKSKIESDGVKKMKDGDYKMKIDSEGNFLEKDSTFKAKVKTDGSVKLKDDTYKGKVDTEGEMKEKTPAEKRKIKKDKQKTKRKEGNQ